MSDECFRKYFQIKAVPDLPPSRALGTVQVLTK